MSKSGTWPQTGRPAPRCSPCTGGRFRGARDDEQVDTAFCKFGSPTFGVTRSRREPPSGVRRQPLLRGPVQDPEVRGHPGFPGGGFDDITARRSPSADDVASLGTEIPNIAMAPGSPCLTRGRLCTTIRTQSHSCRGAARADPSSRLEPQPGPSHPERFVPEGSHNRIALDPACTVLAMINPPVTPTTGETARKSQSSLSSKFAILC